MSIAQDFADNAGNEAWIVDFFDRHIAMVVYGLQQNEKGVYPINVYDGWRNGGFDMGYQGRSYGGGALPIVSLGNEGKSSDTFDAYRCPYEKNAAAHAHLKDAADYMFSAKMDGCSFGIGMPSSTGSVYVAHANRGGDGEAQLAQLRGHTKMQGNLQQCSFDPANYRFTLEDASSSMATTFGLHVDGAWKFYSQVILVDVIGRKLTHYGVVPIA
jgi:hypothetical protein